MVYTSSALGRPGRSRFPVGPALRGPVGAGRAAAIDTEGHRNDVIQHRMPHPPAWTAWAG